MNIPIRNLLREEFEISRNQKSFTSNLKQMIFNIIHSALSKHYGINYSTRCLQSTYGIMTILDYFKVKSFVVEGSACFGLVYGNNPYRITYGGFWDKDHHYWLTSEYGDIIDFSISQLHMHPFEKFGDQVPILPIWWSPLDIFPPIFKYLPNNFGRPRDQLEAEESIKLKKFKDDIIKNIEEATFNSNEIVKFEILTGPEKFTQLCEQRNIWIDVFIQKHQELKLPQWILERERKLIENYANNRNKRNDD